MKRWRLYFLEKIRNMKNVLANMKGVLKILPLFPEEEQRNRKSAKKSTLVKGIEKTEKTS